MSERQLSIDYLVSEMKKLDIRVFENDLDKLLNLLNSTKAKEEENIKRAFWDGSQCEHDYIGIEEIYFNDKYSEHIEVNKSINRLTSRK
jgi:hypothetical protein